MIQHSKVSDEVALFNINSHMMAVMMIQHSKVSDEVALFNVHSHTDGCFIMIRHQYESVRRGN